MDNVNEDKKTRRLRRTKVAVEESIILSAEKEILENGFSDAVVSNIVKRAKIEPRVFYSRYKNLEDFYKSFVKRFDYWFNDLIDDLDIDKKNMVSAESLTKILISLLENLSKGTVMLELLRWEVAKGNDLTQQTASLREYHTLQLAHEFDHVFRDSGIDIVGLSTLLIAGIYYLILHKDRSDFCGINLREEQGKQRLKNTITWIVDTVFALKEERKRDMVIAERMKANGMSEEVIRECLK